MNYWNERNRADSLQHQLTAEQQSRSSDVQRLNSQNALLASEAAGSEERASRMMESALVMALKMQQMNNRIAELERELILANANIEGQKAMRTKLVQWLEAFIPRHPLNAMSKVLYSRGEKMGQPKTNGRIIWEEAFDAHCRANGISDPVNCRGD